MSDASHQANQTVTANGATDMLNRNEFENVIQFLKGFVIATDKVKLAI
jgi:hypothetical protein